MRGQPSNSCLHRSAIVSLHMRCCSSHPNKELLHCCIGDISPFYLPSSRLCVVIIPPSAFVMWIFFGVVIHC